MLGCARLSCLLVGKRAFRSTCSLLLVMFPLFHFFQYIPLSFPRKTKVPNRDLKVMRDTLRFGLIANFIV